MIFNTIYVLLLLFTGIGSSWLFNTEYDFWTGHCSGHWFCLGSNYAVCCSYYMVPGCIIVGFPVFIIIIVGCFFIVKYFEEIE